MSDETTSVRVMIVGRVQGVGYRAWCQREAARLGLSGWVRNRSTGEVEALFCGPDAVVEQMLLRCESGPGWARVDEVRVFRDTARVVGAFEIRATR